MNDLEMTGGNFVSHKVNIKLEMLSFFGVESSCRHIYGVNIFIIDNHGNAEIGMKLLEEVTMKNNFDDYIGYKYVLGHEIGTRYNVMMFRGS